MRLIEILQIKPGTMLSITGAGGKSTLMYTLSEELRKESKCLVTTTTKIYMPRKNQFDFMALNAEDFKVLRLSNLNGVYVCGSGTNDENKLLGVRPESLEDIRKDFEYIIIEADGSKRKPIKGWQDNEPVICRCTTHTIGVLSIESLGKEINENNVHRVNEFIKITNSKLKDKITKKHFTDLIFHPKGLFKNSLGEKILFINKVENDEQWAEAVQLLHCIKDRNSKLQLINKIIAGSLKQKHYKVQRDD